MTSEEVSTQLKERFWSKAALFGYIKFAMQLVAGFSALWFIGRPALDEYVEGKINEVNDKPGFRDILGEEMGLPSDVVPYEIAKKFAEFDSLIADVSSFSDVYLPYIDKEMTRTIPHLYLDENGEEWWHARDGRDYRVQEYVNGEGRFFYHGNYRFIFH